MDVHFRFAGAGISTEYKSRFDAKFVPAQNVGMQCIPYHQDVFFAENTLWVVDVFKRKIEHLRVGLAEMDETLIDDALHQFGDAASGYRNIIFSYGIKIIWVGDDDGYVFFANQVHRFIDVVIPIKALIVQKNHRFTKSNGEIKKILYCHILIMNNI